MKSSRPEVFSGTDKKDVLRNVLWHRSFPVNFAKFLRTPFLTEHLRWLLLYHVKNSKIGCNWIFQIIIGYYNWIFLISFCLVACVFVFVVVVWS